MANVGLRYVLFYPFGATRGETYFEFTYTVNNMPVRKVQCMKDLGVPAARDLLWNSLINTLVYKCNRNVGMIKCWLQSSYNH